MVRNLEISAGRRDPPAHALYGARLAFNNRRILLADLDKIGVELIPNFDAGRLMNRFFFLRNPNLLLMDQKGLPFGIGDKIPPHNLRRIG